MTTPDANAEDTTSGYEPSKKGAAFWLSLFAVIVCTFVSALDQTAISIALPTITEELQGGDEFVWVGASYGVASTAILPLSGRLADAFGRRPIMLAAVAFFFIGSTISAVQGIGGGCILNLTEIIISDLVPLAERGIYMGLFAFVWALASGVGPPIGGALAQASAWRWIFYLNLPLTGIAFVLVLFFLRVRTPDGTIKEKLARLDTFGNSLIVIGITLALIGLTFGGVRYAWSNVHVLAPLILGLALMVAFFLYEWIVPKYASIPWDIVNNRTTVSGYLGTFFHGITSCTVFYYLPVYFQACKGASPLRSSVEFLPMTLIIAPSALIIAGLVQKLQQYRWMNIIGWSLSLVGFGILSLLEPDSSTGKWVGFEVLTAFSIGLLYSVTVFPVLAPLPVSRTAAALAFFSFCRTIAQTWGVIIGSTILQNRLRATLPPSFDALFPEGVQIAYAAIPVIDALDEPVRTQVRRAFADSLAVVWQTMVGVSGLGLVTVALMREVPMQRMTDETYGLDVTRARQSEGSVALGTGGDSEKGTGSLKDNEAHES